MCQNKTNHPYQLLNLLAIVFSISNKAESNPLSTTTGEKEFLLQVLKPEKLAHFSLLKTHHEHRQMSILQCDFASSETIG